MSDLVQKYYRHIARENQRTGSFDEAITRVRDNARDFNPHFGEEDEAALLAAADQLKRELAARIEYLTPGTIIDRPAGPGWYAGWMQGDRHWPKVRDYLLNEKHWNEDTVNSIDQSSDDVLAVLGNPDDATMDVRGLVLGYVQSGKTANMTGVIAKAADRGYNFVILLAGLTNALRRQTQGRMESDLIDRNRFNWDLQTTREDNGDFARPANGAFLALTSDDARFAVIKKNVSPLNALISTLGETPDAVLNQFRFLVIDDECDQASVNGTGTEYDTTVINGQIRQLLALMPRVSYVGYTATPFANVFINPFQPGTQMPEDLYPRSFIKALDMPVGYFGAERLFGREPISEDDPGAEGLDMIRTVEPEEIDSLRPRRMRDRADFEPVVTPSLAEAIRYYLLATAARFERGDSDEHSCMLVHTSVNTDVHDSVARVIGEYLEDLKSRFPTDETLKQELRELWAREVQAVPAAEWQHEPDDPEAVIHRVGNVLNEVTICIENAASDERLDFESGPKRYIVVGGSVLARGLTIEGLVVSLFIRSSSQYDTLMQMGRWFGYRFGYEDLPRIWMPGPLTESFRDLARVEAEIRDDIRLYAEQKITPMDFAVRVRRIPGLQITARNKMRATHECDISYSNAHKQTFRFSHNDEDWLRENWDAGSVFVDRIVEAGGEIDETGRGGRVIRNVPANFVLQFLEAYQAHETHRDFAANGIARYIETENGSTERLQDWTVGIIEPANTQMSDMQLGAFGEVRTVRRSRLKTDDTEADADIKALMTMTDILIDVPEAQHETNSWDRLKAVRAAAGSSGPLLLLYAINARSEPQSPKNREALDAVRDVLGVGVVFPDLGNNATYISVELPDQPDPEDEDLDEALRALHPEAVVDDE